MKILTSIIFLHLFLMPVLFAQQTGEEDVLENALQVFLEGASENNAEAHDRFWAEDLIYTSSNGERVTKEIIMDGLSDNSQATNQQTQAYHAEEIQIQLFDDMAVVAFKLVSISEPESEERLEFYNTGTFQKRDGKWKAVAWQATRIPEE